MSPLAFDEAFSQLRQLVLRRSGGLQVTRDAPGELVVRTPDLDPKTGEPGWFAMLNIKKSYVALHLMPIYCRPELAGNISAALSKRRQGKTCFNFKAPDEALFAEIDTLISACREAARPG